MLVATIDKFHMIHGLTKHCLLFDASLSLSHVGMKDSKQQKNPTAFIAIPAYATITLSLEDSYKLYTEY